MVQEFMEQAGQECPDSLMIPDSDIRALRVRLILEELLEFAHASARCITWDEDAEKFFVDEALPQVYANIENAADAIGDLLYVVYGAAIAWGIKIDPVFGAIHQANMLKMTGPRRADGKQLKPEGWQPPDIKAVLDAQMA